MDAGPTDQEDELVVAPVPEAPAGGRRRGRIAFAAALVLGAVAIPTTLVFLGRDTPPEEVTAAVPDEATTTTTEKVDPSSTTTTSVPPTTETTAATLPPTVDTTAPVAPRPTTPRRPPPPAAAPTATTVPPGPTCRNSHDPACGAFYWDQPVVNQPITASFVDMPAQLSWTNHQLDMSVRMSDDSYFIWSSTTVNGVVVSGTSRVRNCDWIQPRYGPWTPEQPRPIVEHTFFINPVYLTEPGTYLVELSLGTGTCGDAHASDTLLTATVEVLAPPEG